MATSRRAWQMFETRAAAFFGARRKVLSGSAGRDDSDGSDSTHERLHIECKLREKHTVYRVWDAACKAIARQKERGKTPVICLQEKNRPGFLVVVHSDDFNLAMIERLATLDDDELLAIEAAFRELRVGVEEAVS